MVFATTCLMLRGMSNGVGMHGHFATMDWPWLREFWVYAMVTVPYYAALLFSWHWQLEAHSKYCSLLTSVLVFLILWTLEHPTSAA
eukprot:9017291-Karenia_brevis.AAC.1